MAGNIFNNMMLEVARFGVISKQAFVDPATAGGGAGGDPAQGGGDPSAGGDPSMGGGAPPPDPSAGGGAPPPAAPGPDIGMMIQQAVQTAMQQQGGGGGGGGGMGGGMAGGMGGPPKMKIDVNIEIMQMKKMLAKIVDALGIPVPAQDLAIDQNDVTQMAQQQAGGASGGAGSISAIAPPSPIQPAMPGGGAGGGDPSKQGAWENGSPFYDSGITQMRDKAAALAFHLRRTRAA